MWTQTDGRSRPRGQIKCQTVGNKEQLPVSSITALESPITQNSSRRTGFAALNDGASHDRSHPLNFFTCCKNYNRKPLRVLSGLRLIAQHKGVRDSKAGENYTQVVKKKQQKKNSWDMCFQSQYLVEPVLLQVFYVDFFPPHMTEIHLSLATNSQLNFSLGFDWAIVMHEYVFIPRTKNGGAAYSFYAPQIWNKSPENWQTSKNVFFVCFF